MNDYISNLMSSNSLILFFFLTWSLVWKGVALWTSATKNHKTWFVLILIVNTLGILEILYIFFLNRFNLDNYVIKVKSLFTSRLKKRNIN